MTLNYSPGRRAASYWFADGLPDLVLGVELATAGALGFVWLSLVTGPWRSFYLLILAVAFVLLSWKGRAIVEIPKSHLTYPRTGYAQPPEDSQPASPLTKLGLQPQPPAPQNITHFYSRTMMLIWWIVFLSFNQKPPEPLIPLAGTPLLAILLYLVHRKSEHPYRWWAAAILAVSGLIFLWDGIPPEFLAAVQLLLVGGWLMGLGAVMLIRYLHANPYPQTSEGADA
jgi:hypothetical protein